MELDAIPQPELERIERVGKVDLAVGILGLDALAGGCSAVTVTRDALAGFPNPLRAMVVCDTPGSNNGAQGPAVDLPDVSLPEAAPQVFSCSLPLTGPAGTPLRSISQAYRGIFAVAQRLGARACTVVSAHSDVQAREWIQKLARPVLDLGFDLVAPCYTRSKLEGLLNRSVLAPLHRALYGERLENPMGPDFGISAKLMQQFLKQDSSRRNGVERNALVLIGPAAACGGLQICESHLGAREQRPTDWGNLSSLLAEVLGAMFDEVEARAAYWQSVRGSKTVQVFGLAEPAPPDTGNVDIQSMIESFHLGAQNLQDVWGLILPPTTLLELKRLSRMPKDQFRLPDNVWVRIIYDFALGHRLRIMSRDHLLRSITPLYLGWIASYAIEMQTSEPAEIEARLERLSKAYEDSKSYLVSRWRWPDRFNP